MLKYIIHIQNLNINLAHIFHLPFFACHYPYTLRSVIMLKKKGAVSKQHIQGKD